MDLLTLLIILFMGLLSGAVGTLVGGSGLIVIPTLILMGLPAQIAVDTNKVGVIGLNWTGLYKFDTLNRVSYKTGIAVGTAALAGSLIGANILVQIDDHVLKKVIGLLSITGLLLMIGNPQIGVDKSKKKV